MKKVLIMRGVSGAGKTTYVEGIAKSLDVDQVHVVSADDYFIRRMDKQSRYTGKTHSYREYDFDPRLLPKAHSWCMVSFLGLLGQQEPFVVVDNTNIHRWEYEPYEMAARVLGYDVLIVEVMPESIDEVRLCAERNVHNVPVEVVARMAVEFEPDSRAEKFPVVIR